MNAPAAGTHHGSGDTFIRSARRKQLVHSAIEVIAELGAERASVVKIAQHAGVSRGVIGYHFRDLDDLHDAVVAEVYRLGGERLRDRVADADTARDALTVFVAGSLDFYAECPRHIAALHEIFTAARPTSGRARVDSAHHTTELDDVAHVLRDGQAEGQFRDFDADVMARTIRAVLDAGRVALARGADVAHLRTELVASVDALTRKEDGR